MLLHMGKGSVSHLHFGHIHRKQLSLSGQQLHGGQRCVMLLGAEDQPAQAVLIHAGLDGDVGSPGGLQGPAVNDKFQVGGLEVA